MTSGPSERTAIRQTVWYLAAAVIVGWVAYVFAGEPRWIHATVFGIIAAAGAVLAVVSGWISTRFDGILADVVKHDDPVRIRGISQYIGRIRRQMVGFFGIAGLAWVTAAGMSTLLFKYDKLARPELDWVFSVGYASSAVVVLFAIRIGRLYIGLDTFRLELFESLGAEKKRIETMRALNRSPLSSLVEGSGPPARSRRSRRKNTGE